MNKLLHFKKVVLVLLLLVGALNVYSQHVVTGKVIDEQGPLIGASVTIKDAAVPTGTVTDAEGKYSIKVPNSKTILVYSYIGYVDKAEAVGKRTVVNVTLEEDSKMLDDVVVIGYGTQAKSHLTGSISKLEGEKLINAPVSDMTTALQGSMSGLTVSNETSEVGVTPSIRVRGTGSISAESEPLVIIDGFPVAGGLSSINAADVKSIEILKDAASLHEDLRNYGNLKDIDKPLVVSGILLALNEIEKKSFSIDNLVGDTVETDGQKIYKAIESNLKRVNVQPQVKLDKILSQFSIIRDTQILNEINDTLGETPLKYYAKFLYEKIFKSIKYTSSSEDYLGRFYGEFMSYSGGDGQTLGIVLTPKHITELFCELPDLKPEDVVLDPCCGTAGFLIAAMHMMLKKAKDDTQKKHIRKEQLHGIELQPYMFTIATTNMILRGDGKSNLINENFLKQESDKLQLKSPTVGMMNPPYSQGSKKNPDLYEICFTEHLLDSLVEGGRCAVIVPQSSMTGKTKEEQAVKENILKHHTLEGVITLNKDTFYGVGVMPCIAIFTAGEPHPANKECKFINFENDGYKVSPHIGLIETESAKDKKQHLLDVWFDRIEADTKFCVKTTIEATDEWLHSFYYFNDEIPTDADFDKTVGDYLSFEFSMIMQGRKYLFEEDE